MEARVMRAGFQRTLRLASSLSHPQTLPTRPAWSKLTSQCKPISQVKPQSSHYHTSPPRRFPENYTPESTSPEDSQFENKGAIESELDVDEDADGIEESAAANDFDAEMGAIEEEARAEEDDLEEASEEDDTDADFNLTSLRIVPASASYFTAQPRFTDDVLRLTTLLRSCVTLPVVAPGEAPRVSWITYAQYTSSNTEPIRKSRYARLLRVLHRLNHIHPALVPPEVTAELQKWKRAVQPYLQAKKPQLVDDFGRSRAVGRRKTSHAVVWLVEGDGQVRVNGRTLTEAFGRLHDRESAVWALKATQRIDKYNVWAIVRGGGTTGQAEAMTLGVAKALLVQEPALKPALRRAGCVRRDPRMVERKKPGHLKARKMPTWVKR